MISEDFGISVATPLRDPISGFRVGCEFEIEDIKSHEQVSDFVSITNDGSLRNGGYEYITPAITVPEALTTFSKLHSLLVYGNEPFTERTSIHVHVNCCNLTQLEVRGIVLLYALFEEAFFMMVDPSRRDNIHCVALTETHLPSIYRTGLSTWVSKWHKYTALNLKPLSTQGTIEFRHMHGHNEFVVFEAWILLLEKLVSLGRGFAVTAENLEEDNLAMIFNELFGHTVLKNQWASIRFAMENQIMDVKLSTI